MTRPYIIEAGRGRLILNEMPDGGSVTVEVNGAGFTLLLDGNQNLAVGAWFTQNGKRAKR